MRKEGGEGEERRSQDGWVPKAVMLRVSAAETHRGAGHTGAVQSELHDTDLLISCCKYPSPGFYLL